GPGPAAFDSMQQGQRDDFAGIQFGLRVFRDLQHLLVHRVEQCDNKILGSHTPGSARLKSVQPQLELSRDYLSTRTLAITYQTNTIGYYDHYQWAEDAGIDGLMINEHHNTPSCIDGA